MFRLRGRLVDPSLNRVTSDGLTVQVEPKIMHVLVALADRPGEVVTRDELMACVWPGVFVTDDVLHRAIRELRRLFADDAEQPAVIETIRKRGYRLIAPIERIDRPAGPARGVSVPDQSAYRIRRRGGAPAVARRDAPHRQPPATWTPRFAAIGVLLVAATLAGIAVLRFGLGRPASVDTEARVRFTPLTSEPGNEVEPALSASGRLAYVARAARRPRAPVHQNVAGGAGGANHARRRSRVRARLVA